MIQDIIRYMEFLEKEYNFSVSVHGKDRKEQGSVDKLAPFNIHRNGYCLFVTGDKEQHAYCVAYQDSIREMKLTEICYMTCPCGVGQFVVPIVYQKESLGFLCVSGYVGDAQKLYSGKVDCLKKRIPDMERISLLLRPLAAMLAVLFTENPKQAEEKSDLYRHILSVIHANIDKKLTVEKIGKLCFCSASTVSHVFRKRSGVSVQTYIQNLRMKQAEELLLETELSVTEIAYRCGFADANYFVYQFGKQKGAPPLRFRKKEQKV